VRRVAPPQHDSVAFAVDEQRLVRPLGHRPARRRGRLVDLRRCHHASGGLAAQGLHVGEGPLQGASVGLRSIPTAFLVTRWAHD
jgi:hypothetical protein